MSPVSMAEDLVAPGTERETYTAASVFLADLSQREHGDIL
jgi:hypothetical protein